MSLHVCPYIPILKSTRGKCKMYILQSALVNKQTANFKVTGHNSCIWTLACLFLAIKKNQVWAWTRTQNPHCCALALRPADARCSVTSSSFSPISENTQIEQLRLPLLGQTHTNVSVSTGTFFFFFLNTKEYFSQSHTINTIWTVDSHIHLRRYHLYHLAYI